ncbi:MAG: hypothetical protein VZS44_11950 [Bacilli bacterium]|nr:hypothetical protein [Bacilli bacterium]
MKFNYNPQNNNNYQGTQPNNQTDYRQNYQPNYQQGYQPNYNYQQSYQQPPTYPQNNYPQENKPNNTLGILSIILGIFIPLVGIILGIIGINKAKTSNSNKKLSIIGIIISIVMLIFYLIIFIILIMFGEGGIRGFGHYSSRGYGNSSYSSVIEDYYEAYNDRDEDKANKCFPYGSTTTIDFSNTYGEFDTNTIDNTYKSSGDIDKYNEKFDMKFDDVIIYESICFFVYDSDPGIQSNYKLEFTIGEYDDTYFILNVEDMGFISDVEEENMEIVEDLPTFEDITEATTEATTETTTETTTEVTTETTTEATTETSSFEGDTIGNDEIGYINISKATTDKFMNTTSENIFNASVDGVSNYQFYSNESYTININMYEVDNVTASIDTIANTYKEEYENQLAQIDTEYTSNVITLSNCMIGNSGSDYYKEGKLLWFQLQDDTLSKLGYGSIYESVYLWEDEGNLHMVEIIYTDSDSEEIANKIMKNYHK